MAGLQGGPFRDAFHADTEAARPPPRPRNHKGGLPRRAATPHENRHAREQDDQTDEPRPGGERRSGLARRGGRRHQRGRAEAGQPVRPAGRGGRRRRRRDRRRAGRRRRADRADRPRRPRAGGAVRQGRRAPPGRRRDGAGDHRAAPRAVAVRDAGGRREQAAAREPGQQRGARLLLPRRARLQRLGPHPGRRGRREVGHAVLRRAQELRAHGQGQLAHAGPRRRRFVQGQPVGGRLLRLRRREPAARRPVRVGGDARLAAAPDRRHRAGPAPGRAGLRRAQDLLRHQRHVDRQQGDLPDAAGAGRQDAARPQLPQVGPPRRDPVGRAADLSRLVGQPQVRPVRPGAARHGAGRHRAASRRARADPHLVHLRRPALRPAGPSSRPRTPPASR